MNHADWQGSIQTFLSKKNANALESAVWVVEYCDFLKFAFVVGFLVFSCCFSYIPVFVICKKTVKNSHSCLLCHNTVLNLQECMADFKITYTTDSAMRSVDIPGRPSAKSTKGAVDMEVELWMAFLPRR